MILSPEATESKNEAARNERHKERRYRQGPHLSESGGVIIVPSPFYNGQLKNALKTKGFTFWGGAAAHWNRSTARTDGGKVRAPSWWLAWAVLEYGKAWPDWAAQREEEAE